jgi:hypothetical protein
MEQESYRLTWHWLGRRERPIGGDMGRTEKQFTGRIQSWTTDPEWLCI